MINGRVVTHWSTAAIAAVLNLALVSAATAQSKVAVGVMPVYDGSGARYGEQLAPYLTELLFKQLLQRPDVEPVYLNPGAGYTPLDMDSALDYAASAPIDAVVAATLRPAERPRTNEPTLLLELVVMDLKKGQRTLTLRTTAKRKDLEEGFDAGQVSRTVSIFGEVTQTARPSRRLEKQPLGKAGQRLAEQATASIPALVHAVAPSASRPARVASAATCDVTVTVRYVRQRTASKNYLLIVNDREESNTVIDGVAKLRLPAGNMVAEIIVKDAPFRMPIQAEYLTNTFVDCAQTRTLALEIGAVGEAMLVWRTD